MPITLTVVCGPHTGKTYTLDRHDTFIVGRADDAHLSLSNDPYFSRHHLLIEANPPLCRLTDLNSRNGTILNNARVTTAELKDGDEVAGGQTTLKVSIATTTGGAPTLDLPAVGGPDAGGRTTPVGPLEERELPHGSPVDRRSIWPVAECELVTIPGYRELTEIGRGAMGIVYRAVRNLDEATVAVKTVRPTLAPTREEVARFLREARVLESLGHPRIVQFYESGEADGVLFFAMEYVDGTDAARLIKQAGPLPVNEAVELIEQLCESLSHSHAKGFVHRDVKPANLLLASRGGRWDLKLADFGLAKAYQGTRMSGLTVSGSIAGTPAFMPPEQITNFKAAKPSADQYAAGATAYFLLTGAFPFGTGPTQAILKRVLVGDADRLESQRPDVPKPVADAIGRAMHVRATERFSDVAAFASALRKAVC